MKRNRTSGQSGFSLVEVLASVTIFSIVAAGLAATSINVIRANAVSRDVVSATALAQDVIETLRSLDTAGGAVIPAGQDQVDAEGNPGGKFQRSWTVGDGPTAWIAEVTVRVAWSSPQPRSVETTAFMCRRPTC